MKNEKGTYSKKAILGVALLVVMSASFTFGMIVNDVAYDGVTFEEAVEQHTGSWHVLAADASGGTDSIVNVYIYPLSEKADITASPYECNEADAYEHGDADGFSDGEELEDETAIGSTYIIAIEVNFSSKGYNTTSSDWENALVKAVITDTELSLSAVEMEEGTDFSQQDGSTSAHMTFYVDNSDSGWTMTTGYTNTIDDIDIFYWA